MIRYSPADIDEQLRKAASVMRRLPPVKKPRMAQSRLLFVRSFKDRWVAALENGYDKINLDEIERAIPPSVNEIAGMDEALGWLQLIEAVDDRDILWARANGIRWAVICRRYGVSRKTAWQRWTASILTIAALLNGEAVSSTRSGTLRRRQNGKKLEPIARL